MTLAKKISPEERVKAYLVSATDTELLQLQKDISLVMSLKFAALPAKAPKTSRLAKGKALVLATPEATA